MPNTPPTQAFRNPGTDARTHPLLIFYLLAFSISWLGFLPGLYPQIFRSPVWIATALLPGIGPALAAFLTLRLTGNPHPLATLLPRRKPAPTLFLLAIATPAVLILLSNLLIHPTHPFLTARSPGRPFLLFAAAALFANPCEEIGWRGFALPHLQARHTSLTAACIVGILWGLWHLPLLLTRTGPMAMARLPLLPWSLHVLSASVILAWLYNRSKRSIIPVSLFHIATNLFAATLGIASYRLFALLTLALALALIRKYGPNLGRTGPAPHPSPTL